MKEASCQGDLLPCLASFGTNAHVYSSDVSTMTTASTLINSSPKEVANGLPKPISARRKFSISIPPRTANEIMSGGGLKTPTHSIKTQSPNGSYTSDGILSKSGRQRQLSMSSADAENAMDLSNDDEIEGNPRKRGSSDTVDYPRRRATIAVSPNDDPWCP